MHSKMHSEYELLENPEGNSPFCCHACDPCATICLNITLPPYLLTMLVLKSKIPCLLMLWPRRLHCLVFVKNSAVWRRLHGGARPILAFTRNVRFLWLCSSCSPALHCAHAIDYFLPLFCLCRYFNAMHKSGPQSSSRLELPSTTELASWLDQRGPVERPALASIPFVCADNLGFYLFLKYDRIFMFLCWCNGRLK